MCVAIPGQVTWMGEPGAGSITGRVTFGEWESEVNLVMVPDVRVGQHVIVHSGFAIRVVDVVELDLIRELYD